MTIILANGPKVPAHGTTAAWRSVLVQEPTELVVYAEYFNDTGSYYSHGVYFDSVCRDMRRIDEIRG